jgi:hypothetical protein
MIRFKQIREDAVWLFDWYCRLETVGKWIAGIGFVGAWVTSGLAFWATVVRGLDPLLGVFFALFALLLCGMFVLVVMEVTGTRIPPKTIRLRDRVLAAHTAQFAVSGAQASVSMVVTRANQPLRDAARMAFEAIQNTEHGVVIAGLNQTAEERLGYFMSDLAGQGVRHYGKKPPSSVPMEIPSQELVRLHPITSENALIAMFERHPAYVDVTVDGESLRAYLDKLPTRYP